MQTLNKQISLFTEEELTYSAEASPVSPSQSQESGWARMTRDTSGRKCLEQLERFSHVGLLVKTFLACLIGREGWYSTRCIMTWKLRVTKSGRMYCQLAASTLPTKETEYGLLLTPTTREEVMDLDQFRKRMKKYPNGTTMPNLATQVTTLLPTPIAWDGNGGGARPVKNGKTEYSQEYSQRLKDMAKANLLPTPAAQNYRGASSTEALEARGRLKEKADNLADQFAQSGKSSQLNPLFVEEMMGFPENWILSPFLNGEENH